MMKTQHLTFLLYLLLFTFFSTIHPISAVNNVDPTNPSSITTNTTTTTTTSTNDTDFIRTSCGTTLYPDLCYNSLSPYSKPIRRNPAQLAQIAIIISLSKTQHITAYVSNVSRDGNYDADGPGATLALHDCSKNLGDSVYQIRSSLKQMRSLRSTTGESFKFEMSNVQTWMSAALTDQETCTDGFQDVDDCSLKTEVVDRVGEVKKYMSNALALVNRYVEKESP